MSTRKSLEKKPDSLQVNAPAWNSQLLTTRRGFHESWSLSLTDPSGTQALLLRFTLLMTKNRFHKIAETWAVYYRREPNQEVSKWAVKQSFPIGTFQVPASGTIQIGDCLLSPGFTRGQIVSKGHNITWELQLNSQSDYPVILVPHSLQKLKIIENDLWSASEHLSATGTIQVNGNPMAFSELRGSQGHTSGPKSGHSWVRGHANSFINEKGEPVDFIFDGITAKARMTGGLSTPRISSFYFFHQGKHYHFNTIWDALHVRSKNTINSWQFQADRGELSFRGIMKAEHKDFAGLQYEDTDGSTLYCATSKLSDLQIHVYRNGKIESTFNAHATASFEVASRSKNPYVTFLI